MDTAPARVIAADLTRRQWIAGLAVILLCGAILRGIFPTADPPWQTTVGITWHDEGPWVHNARNKVLFGAWRLDGWNPMYLTPVFTALEFASFSAFGVGHWQARLVSMVMGLSSVLFLSLGVAAIATRRASLIAAALAASSYFYVMWNRAALMETTMTAFIVIAWGAYAMARQRGAWGLLAGSAAVLAFFTKAAAAFFIAAVAIELVWTLVGAGLARRLRLPGAASAVTPRSERAAAWWTLAGLAAAGLAFLAWFVVPFWEEFRFYNWQMSVTRKPSYTLQAFVDRASWLPIVHDFFTRAWFLTVLGVAACAGVAMRWTRATGAERLLALWLVMGTAELLVHDVGNERRLVFFTPALVGLAALVLDRGRLFGADAETPARWRLPARLVLLPAVAYGAYVLAGPIARLPFLYEVRPGVRTAAGVALVLTTLLCFRWQPVWTWLHRQSWTPRAAVLLTALLVLGDLAQFAQWSAGRTYRNVTASRLLGEWLPAGTLVHGKLANGLALENRIRPVFVGRGFGNYDDRLSRPDIRYVLTYVAPRLGYEGPVILDVLGAHPGWRILRTFEVAETAGGADRAALIEKPAAGDAFPSRSPRAQD